MYERQLKYYKNEICKKELIIQTNIEKVENIMIVAHPDDETIFGFNELHNTDKKWLLIVCTNSIDGRIGLLRKDIPGLIQMSKDYSFNLVVMEHFDIKYFKIESSTSKVRTCESFKVNIDFIFEIPSTCPKTKWPPNSSPTLKDFSKFSFKPTL